MGLSVICITQIKYNPDKNTFSKKKCDADFSIQTFLKFCGIFCHQQSIDMCVLFSVQNCVKVHFFNPFLTNYPDH